jgi:hypothetical protein
MPVKKHREDYLKALPEKLAGCPGISEIEINPVTGSVLVKHDGNTRDILDFVHPDDRRLSADRMEAALLGGLPNPALERKLLRRDGGDRRRFDGRGAERVCLRHARSRARVSESISSQASNDSQARPSRRMASWCRAQRRSRRAAS